MERERPIEAIEATALAMQEHGLVNMWLSGADPGVAKASLCFSHRWPLLHVVLGQVVDGVNGPLMLELARACEYHDTSAVEMFRTGGHLVNASFCVSLVSCWLLLHLCAGRATRLHWQ